MHWRAVARALHADDSPRGRLATRASNAALRIRLRFLCGVMPRGVGLHVLGKASGLTYSCSALHDKDHWLTCPDSEAPMEAARDQLTDQIRF